MISRATIARSSFARSSFALSSFGGVLAGTGLVFVAGLLLGGGTENRFLGDVVVQLLSIPLLLVALRFWGGAIAAGDLPKGTGLALGLCMAIVLVPVAQLMPLPPAIWAALPGRDGIAATFKMLGRELPWRPLSVWPHATWLSLLSLLPAVAIFLGVLRVGYRGRRMLTLCVVAVATISVFLGLSQLAQGPASPLRFFEFTNSYDAVGFFANRNHLSALLYAALPLTAAWALTAAADLADARRQKEVGAAHVLPCLIGLMVIVLLIVGQMMTRSRAGLGLSMVALLGMLLLTVGRRHQVSSAGRRMLLIGVLAAVVVSMQFALFRVLDRMTIDSLGDTRQVIGQYTITAARAYMPFGSGVGTFVPIYAGFEKARDAQPFYANRAHDDWLEVWLETGVAGGILAAAFVAWFLGRALVVWRGRLARAGDIDLLIARAASLVVVLLVAHSLVDYPLRTTAMATLFALCCALMCPPPEDSLASEARVDSAVVTAPKQPARPKAARPAVAIRDAGPGLAPIGDKAGVPLAWPMAVQPPAAPPGATAPATAPAWAGASDPPPAPNWAAPGQPAKEATTDWPESWVKAAVPARRGGPSESGQGTPES